MVLLVEEERTEVAVEGVGGVGDTGLMGDVFPLFRLQGKKTIALSLGRE